MYDPSSLSQRVSIGLGCAILTLLANFCSAQNGAQAGASSPVVLVLEVTGKVEVLRAGRRFEAKPKMTLQVGDRVESAADSHVTLRWYNNREFQTLESSILEIPPPKKEKKWSPLRMLKGFFHFLNRGNPEELDLETPTSQAVVLGTEFIVHVAEDGTTTVAVLEGRVRLSNALGEVEIGNGQEGTSGAGAAPMVGPIEVLKQKIQWFLYYPAVLDVEELNLNVDAGLRPSLLAYRSGDLEEALRVYPAGRVASTEDEKVYLAGLRLGLGQVEKAELQLDAIAATNQFADALRRVIASVAGEGNTLPASSTGASGALAASYVAQAEGNLDEALIHARRSVSRSIGFGFAWARVAELEFGRGRLDESRAALRIALELSPKLSEAIVLEGFLLVAVNRTGEAIERFDRAIELNGRVGNAWLGRGLCRMREGDREEGMKDLRTAAALEPQRSVLRSYLGKGFEEAGDPERALRELELASELDPGDPTPWLYAALLKEERNRLNSAVRDLETSQALNDNRRIYRSGQLLDQDRAVRGANLARIYGDVGMDDWSVREASRAVSLDYANYSAHFFLANSYNRLREPSGTEFRYDVPWFSEYLLANLLAPVGAGTLSRTVSQLEYSRLFERDRVGLFSDTAYGSRGVWSTIGGLYGVQGNTEFSLEGAYLSDPGQQPNGQYEAKSGAVRVKQQLTQRDSVFLLGQYFEGEGGDRTRYRDPASSSLLRHTTERQEPLLVAGYHRNWGPGSDTLVVAGRVISDVELEDRSPIFSLTLDMMGNPWQAQFVSAPVEYRSEQEIYTAEAQHILWGEKHRFIAGGRYQTGKYDVANQIGPRVFLIPSTDSAHETEFDRLSGYGYYHWQPMDALQVIGGVTVDYMKYPLNYRSLPVAPGEDETTRVSPKAGLVWSPGKGTVVRGAYTRSMGGVSLDSAYQLEPSQVAGFTQTYRTLVPGTLGEISATRFETWGVALEKRFESGTYVGISAERLRSEAEQEQGVFVRRTPVLTAETRPTEVDFEERSVAATVNQLIDEQWSVGASYRIAEATFDQRLPYLTPATLMGTGVSHHHRLTATLRELDLFTVYNHECGFFSRFDALWFVQDNGQGIPDEDFWHLNLSAGYRFPGRHVEVRLALLNMTDQDYRLNPLNLTRGLPRERMLEARLRWYF